MSYESRVYRILIASPSDVEEEREVAARIIQDWNDLNSFNKKIVLLPIKWETHSSPTYGVRPQEALNKQIVDDCDLLIGFFWSKLGTPTGVDVSGTMEEITRFANAGKPIMLYFSKRGKDPSSIDINQLSSLKTFKDEVYKIALVDNYSSIVDFRDKLSRHLEMKIRELQEIEGGDKDIISFSFINADSGELSDTDNFVKEFERVTVDDETFDELVKTDFRLFNEELSFKSSVNRFLRKNNNIPILIGLKNNSPRILSNVIVDLKLRCSLEDKLLIETIDVQGNYNFYGSFTEYDLPKENIKVIRRLFSKNLIKISPKIWEYYTKPFTLIPQKTFTIESIFFLYPSASLKIDFEATIFSDNLLQPINLTCNFSFKIAERKATKKEIEEIIIAMDEDDLPF